MPRIAGVDIPNDKPTRIALRYIYGIGPKHAEDICKKAEIEPIISFHILRHTHASHLAMNDAPLAVIARQLGHSDTRMAEKHYAHLSTDYITDTIRRSFPKMGLGE